ncbi:hypothetical protein [Mycobacterium parmense]|uniref:Uncharacterized protein n=1 Tax=Mycobacterium parmense TaxID=185642 RepID=A0A7I7YQX0_9MYCO|nr:hypothetical protein [Mycobacterium parmense]MCV7348537.1 hypothetical protein [Mycobacterium parmense]ORW51129.1 hypothetical protein AWC20_23295 [Mycobacterium parmense]BBZ43151.1 hypothetical protein MPRM_04320 [Mycobacterium parmense]
MADDTETEEEITGVPLIFMFQPTKFVVAKGQKLVEWEENMKNLVGIGKFAEIRKKSPDVPTGVETTSISPGAGDDDCDWDIVDVDV